MSEFKKYPRKGFSEMRLADWTDFEVPNKISVSDADRDEVADIIDRKIGDNKAGMIGRNPKNHNDQWYVARKYFEDNF